MAYGKNSRIRKVGKVQIQMSEQDYFFRATLSYTASYNFQQKKEVPDFNNLAPLFIHTPSYSNKEYPNSHSSSHIYPNDNYNRPKFAAPL